MEIVLTEKEMIRKRRNDEILAMYTTMLSEYPDIKPWRILRTIGEKFSLTPEAVSLVLKSMGAYVNNNNQDGNGNEE